MTTMAQPLHQPESPTSAARRPKGILKNSNSFTATSPLPSPDASSTTRPTTQRERSDREITQMNTEINAGGPTNQRRNSSNPRGSLSRRQSSQSGENPPATDDSGQRLKWDEANLYLNEGQMGGRMKITEPKTPFAKNYDPMEEDDDDVDVSNLNAEALAVDELDMGKGTGATRSGRKGSGAAATTKDIPGLDLGEPEMEIDGIGAAADGERRVHVGEEGPAADGGHHGEGEEGMSGEELAKHRKFEEARKKHYEMKNIKNLLGHPENLDALEEDE